MATVKGTTQNKRKREQPNESTMDMSRELFRRETASRMEVVHAWIARYAWDEQSWDGFPQAAVPMKDRSGFFLPILYAVKVTRLLLDSETDKNMIFEKDDMGRLPIHLACQCHAPVAVLQLLLESDTDKRTIFEKDRHEGQLPIHHACENNAPIELIRFLLDNDDDKKSILAKDDFGRLPIHLACKSDAPVEVIQLLLESDTAKRTILAKDRRGKMPIHLACETNAPRKVILFLLANDDDKKSIHAKDDHGRLPIDLACECWGAPVLKVIKLLLQASIGDRIKQLGHQQWRVGVQDLINAMTADDRHSTIEKRHSTMEKVQEIYERLSKYEETEHTISLLALAAWRTSCLRWGDTQFLSMQEMEDLQATDGSFDLAQHKRERRIKSGADVIIRGVLPFLLVDDDDDDDDSDSGDDDDSDSGDDASESSSSEYGDYDSNSESSASDDNDGDSDSESVALGSDAGGI